MLCDSCVCPAMDFLMMITDFEVLIEWLRDHKVLPSRVQMCHWRADCFFICTKPMIEVVKTCKYTSIDFKHTWFSGSGLSLVKICKLTCLWTCLRPDDTLMYQIFIAELNAPRRVVKNWMKFCREVCVDWCERTSEKIGGPGIVVKIILSKFEQLSKNASGIVDGNWVFGGYEPSSKKMFVADVIETTREQLLRVVEEWVYPGTTIVSNCWRTCNCHESEGFVRLTAEQNIKFVDADPGPEILNGVWISASHSGLECPRYSYLCEFLWKRSIPDPNKRLHHVFKDMIAVKYNPQREGFELDQRDGDCLTSSDED